jgi:hypothetical protein
MVKDHMAREKVIPASVIEERLGQIERTIQDLVARRDVYRELLDAATNEPDDDQAPRTIRNDSPAGDSPNEVEPSAAIDELVHNEPGLTRKEVADRLENKVTSTAKNVRAILFTHMRRREQAGEYFKDPKGRLFPKQHPVAVEARSRQQDRSERGGEKGGVTLLDRI